MIRSAGINGFISLIRLLDRYHLNWLAQFLVFEKCQSNCALICFVVPCLERLWLDCLCSWRGTLHSPWISRITVVSNIFAHEQASPTSLAALLCESLRFFHCEEGRVCGDLLWGTELNRSQPAMTEASWKLYSIWFDLICLIFSVWAYPIKFRINRGRD